MGRDGHPSGHFHQGQFQSTRPRGARPRGLQDGQQFSRCFNPRAHVGRDVSCFSPPRADGVSIHAPTWGATSKIVRRSSRLLFQSTRPRGARHAWCMTTAMKKAFQSTRPRGARPYTLKFVIGGFEFQSTRPRGARPLPFAFSGLVGLVSIHAPTWGATDETADTLFDMQFQSTRPRGARLPRWSRHGCR